MFSPVYRALVSEIVGSGGRRKKPGTIHFLGFSFSPFFSLDSLVAESAFPEPGAILAMANLEKAAERLWESSSTLDSDLGKFSPCFLVFSDN